MGERPEREYRLQRLAGGALLLRLTPVAGGVTVVSLAEAEDAGLPQAAFAASLPPPPQIPAG